MEIIFKYVFKAYLIYNRKITIELQLNQLYDLDFPYESFCSIMPENIYMILSCYFKCYISSFIKTLFLKIFTIFFKD